MRLDKDPGDDWSEKFGVECLDGGLPTWEEPDWPTCAIQGSMNFKIAENENWSPLFLCKIEF